MTTDNFILDTRLLKSTMADVLPLGNLTQNLAETIATRHHAKVTKLNLKTVESVSRKCQLRQCQADKLRDLARTTIICSYSSISSIVKDLIETLKKSGNFGRYVQQEYKSRGYWGIIVNPVFFVNGQMIMTEIQISSYEMFYASHSAADCADCLGPNLYNSISKATGIECGKGHLYYEISRDDSGIYTMEQKHQAEQDNYDYYNNFWGSYKFGETNFLN